VLYCGHVYLFQYNTNKSSADVCQVRDRLDLELQFKFYSMLFSFSRRYWPLNHDSGVYTVTHYQKLVNYVKFSKRILKL
jgi:hypothetical protein